MRILALFLLLTLGSAARAETVRFDSKDATFEARGQEILISGKGSNVVISGSPAQVTISGEGHDVVLSETPELLVQGSHCDVKVDRVGAITLTGSHNDVVVSKSRPVVRDSGSNNDIVSVMGVESDAGTVPTNHTSGRGRTVTTSETVVRSGSLAIEGSGRRETMAADSLDVIITGAGNHITLTGRPQSLTVEGSGNTVFLESAEKITVNGAENAVTYRSGRPSIEDVGFGNIIEGP